MQNSKMKNWTLSCNLSRQEKENKVKVGLLKRKYPLKDKTNRFDLPLDVDLMMSNTTVTFLTRLHCSFPD
jgi:hypothetical protein